MLYSFHLTTSEMSCNKIGRGRVYSHAGPGSHSDLAQRREDRDWELRQGLALYVWAEPLNSRVVSNSGLRGGVRVSTLGTRTRALGGRALGSALHPRTAWGPGPAARPSAHRSWGQGRLPPQHRQDAAWHTAACPVDVVDDRSSCVSWTPLSLWGAACAGK